MSSESTDWEPRRGKWPSWSVFSRRWRTGWCPESARGLSHFGEHSLGWLAIAGAGAALARVKGDHAARRRWIEAGVGAFGAHAASVVIKRVVRRPRPNHPDIEIGVGTPSKLSFPSSHATSTTAAAILIGRAAGLLPAALPAVLVPPMLLSRLVLGVHYPTDAGRGRNQSGQRSGRGRR